MQCFCVERNVVNAHQLGSALEINNINNYYHEYRYGEDVHEKHSRLVHQ